MKKSTVFATMVGLCLSVLTRADNGVALVLSGGAAKGITHIGVIKALEENEIPIDYIAGTSMGAIVGGLYASGWTTEEMIELIGSSEFQQWLLGEVDAKKRFYYRQGIQTPSVYDISRKIEISDPQQMNIVVIELFSQPNAACQQNFDSLMIPFRCVASDITHKQAHVFREGDLGDAVRASMSFPFMFRPVQYKDMLLYDGGIYDNFPVDVAISDFHPSYIIGSDVRQFRDSTPDPRNTADIVYRLIQETQVTQMPDNSTYLHFQWDKIRSWDFSQVNTLVRLGYDSTMSHIEEIRAAVSARRTREEVNERRESFKQQMPELNISDIEVYGVSEAQRSFLQSVVRVNEKERDAKVLRSAYFRLLSDENVSEVIPHMYYNEPSDSNSGGYTLRLDITTRDQLKFMLGGNISTSSPTQCYVGVDYNNFRHKPLDAWADLQVGRVYNGIGTGVRLDMHPRLYLKAEVVAHLFQYYENSHFISFDAPIVYFRQREVYGKVGIGTPLTMRSKFELGVGVSWARDHYMQDASQFFEISKADHSSYFLSQVYAMIDGYSLDNLMYATEGTRWHVQLHLANGSERSHSAIYPLSETREPMRWWLGGDAHWEGYYPMGKHFSLGAETELMFSMRPMLSNYTASLIQAPRYCPTPHSQTSFNPSFAAKQYIAGGIKPIVRLTSHWQIRLEGYAFAPIFAIKEDMNDYTAYYSEIFPAVHFLTEGSMVYTFRRGAVAAYANYYSTPDHNWNIGLNCGILLFHEKFIR